MGEKHSSSVVIESKAEPDIFKNNINLYMGEAM